MPWPRLVGSVTGKGSDSQHDAEYLDLRGELKVKAAPGSWSTVMGTIQQRTESPPQELGNRPAMPTHPGSRASRASGVAPGRSGTRGSRYTALGRSYLCTAVHREPRHTRRNLKKTSMSSRRPQSFSSLGSDPGPGPGPGPGPDLIGLQPAGELHVWTGPNS